MKAIEKLIGKRVIIRADRAGVFYGTLAEVASEDQPDAEEVERLRQLMREENERLWKKNSE